ncbi:phosphatase PAP2 family protein [Shewanella spartinae]|uniref:phosphatase PAP2 family protein n=1 Tax=Shewanella spartinae TaxID=2864205 RepID=UPI0021ABAD1E|nr:phosphatase PAP2 family protein [Shewanella spartinae]
MQLKATPLKATPLKAMPLKAKRLQTSALLGASLSFFAMAAPYNAINESIDDGFVEAGDILVIAIPATGYLASWLYDDFEGAKQLTFSVLTTQLIVEATKSTVGRYRPNSNVAGGSYKSFPSGHSAGAFSGAAFLQSRYGNAWGIPAYLGAGVVAASRVHGRRHYADDVLGGAGIAILVNQYFVERYDNQGLAVSLFPNDEGGLQFNLSMPLDGPLNGRAGPRAEKRAQPAVRGPKRHRFAVNLGFNMTDSLGMAGAKDLLPDSQLVDDHQPFSYLLYEYLDSSKTSLQLELSPNETRLFGTLSGEFELDGKQYQDGDSLYLAFKQWSLGSQYFYRFAPQGDWHFKLGGGLYAYLVELEVDYLTGGQYAGEGSLEVMPSIEGRTRYHIGGGLSADAMARFQTWSGNQLVAAEAGLSYALGEEWVMGLKYAYSEAKWDALNMEYQTDSIVLTVENRF